MEQIVSTGIIDSFFKKLKESLSVNVAIVGGGPSGLVAAYFLAKKGIKVSLYERKLVPGGGMWGGAMMFNEIVVQKEAIHILDEFGIDYKHYSDVYYTVNSVHAASALIILFTLSGRLWAKSNATLDHIEHPSTYTLSSLIISIISDI